MAEMYSGYVSNAEQDKARWELMQKRAAAIEQAQQTRQAGKTQPASQEG